MREGIAKDGNRHGARCVDVEGGAKMRFCWLLTLFCNSLHYLRQCFITNGVDVDIGSGEAVEPLAGRDHLRAQPLEGKGVMEVGCHIALPD